MLKKLCLALALLVMPLPFVATAHAQGQSLNDILEPVRKEVGLPALAAAVVKDGRIIASGAVGTRVLGRDIPVTIDDRFHIGSDTKAMTATLAGMLVDEGKLRWDSTIGEVLGADLPGIDPTFAKITLEQLLSHTSGIPTDTKAIYEQYVDGKAYEETLPQSRLRMLRAFGKNPLKVDPNPTFHYANLGYVAAGAMIEKVAGETWEELIRRRLFDPLELKTAGLGPQATRGKFDAPVGHDVDDKGKITPRPWGPGADVPAGLGPAGVAHMSILDFARWAGWNAGEGKRGPALVKPETLKRIHRQHVTMTLENPPPGTPKSGGYGLGWGIAASPWSDNRPVLGHNGSNTMNLATIMVDPQRDIGIVVTTNFPGPKADEALQSLVRTLYQRFAK